MRINSLKEGIVPHKFLWSSVSPIPKRVRNDRMEARKLRKIGEFKYEQATYSTYKNGNTAKVLIGITPGELVSYVSDVYGGLASYHQICEGSALMNSMHSGDSVMADEGFNVQDLFIDSNVQVNIRVFQIKSQKVGTIPA